MHLHLSIPLLAQMFPLTDKVGFVRWCFMLLHALAAKRQSASVGLAILLDIFKTNPYFHVGFSFPFFATGHSQVFDASSLILQVDKVTKE